MENNKHVKILFRFFSDILKEQMMETIWADTVDESRGYYRLDSLPFYVPSVATDDVVHAQYDDSEEMLTYLETVKPSGNSIVWVVITGEQSDIDDVIDYFDEMDCLSEALSDRYFAMEIKAETNFLQVKDRLNELRSAGIIEYTVPCLSARHQY
jgi:hypothetical protein